MYTLSKNKGEISYYNKAHYMCVHVFFRGWGIISQRNHPLTCQLSFLKEVGLE